MSQQHRLTIAGETAGALLLVFLLLLLYLWADDARRDAQEARERAELQTVLLQEQLDCTAGLQAESDAALLAYLVALSSGDGAEVARVDAQQASNRWVEARERCS
jgi:heme A synthase